MALRTIIEKGDKTLSKKCRPVTEINKRIITLLDDMIDTLLDSGGVGLAAPQVGILRRIVLVMDTNKTELSPEEQIIELINPEIIETEGEQDGPEGCLSVPGVFGMVSRPMRVKVRAMDRNGEMFEVWGEGLTARAFCHEIDHLEGVLFLERSTHILTDEELDAMGAED